MSSTPPPKPTVTQILLALLGDAPDIANLVAAIETAITTEHAATTFLARVKAAEPAIEAAASLADKIKGQI